MALYNILSDLKKDKHDMPEIWHNAAHNELLNDMNFSNSLYFMCNSLKIYVSSFFLDFSHDGKNIMEVFKESICHIINHVASSTKPVGPGFTSTWFIKLCRTSHTFNAWQGIHARIRRYLKYEAVPARMPESASTTTNRSDRCRILLRRLQSFIHYNRSVKNILFGLLDLLLNIFRHQSVIVS